MSPSGRAGRAAEPVARVLRARPRAAAIPVLAGAALALALAAGGRDAGEPARVSALPFDGRSPLAAEGPRVRVLVELARPSLGERMAREGLAPAEQRAHVRSLGREASALQGELRANAVELRGVTSYARVLSGFAATIETADLARVQTLGVRVERVVRLYPATQAATAPGGREAPGDARAGAEAERPPPGAASVALLDSGVDLGHPDLRVAVRGLADVVERDGNPAPGALAGRREAHGTQTAAVLARALRGRGRVLAIRVAALERDAASGAVEELATGDALAAGLERAVDPDRDGDVDDAAAVALVGVNAPYAGFAEAPEARAAEAAVALGTLVVAPVGNEGARSGRFGTVGSPAAAPAVLAAGALEGAGEGLPAVRLGLAGEGGRAVLDARVLGGAPRALRGPVSGLAGPSQAEPEARGRAAGADPLDYYAPDARPRGRGRVVIVPARDRSGRRPALADVASAAAAAGAAGLVVCDPAGERPLQALPRGAGAGIPVLGLTGADARRALELSEDDGALALASEPRPRAADGERRVAPASSEGPTYDFVPKPDLLAPGTATAALADGGRGLAAGTSVAAARTAGAALALRVARPGWSAAEAAAALATTARPLAPAARGAGAGAGAGIPDARAAAAAPAIALPHALVLPRAEPARPFAARARLTLANPGARRVRLALRVRLDGAPRGVEVSLPPRVELGAGGRRAIEVVARGRAPRAALVTGQLVARAPGGRALRIPLALPVQPPPPARLGALRLVRDDGRVRGVRFAAGAVRRSDGAVSVLPLERLTLTLVRRGGGVARQLTPRGGARSLLPAEYAYTLTGEALRELPRGTYRFVARARGPAHGAVSERSSPPFEVR